MKIIYDENICVKCLACVSESEFGGVTYQRGRIFFNETCAEDWENIIAICPVGAIKAVGRFSLADDKKNFVERPNNRQKYSLGER